ncbi:hypothetical protein [Paraburkholderia sp. SIMBA_054]|uniref:hypothetical protein n=1 Tax=Paraburkholderia sp. SIMBA_054 TaxID=3085795 RepID=UPI0039791E4A
MLVFTYPCFAGDSWPRIIDALQSQGSGHVTPTDPVRIVVGHGFYFETTIRGLSDGEEIQLVLIFKGDPHIKVR